MGCNEVDEATNSIFRLGEPVVGNISDNEFSGSQRASIWNYYSHFPQQGDPTGPADNRWIDGSTFDFHTYNEDPQSLPGLIYVRPLPGSPSAGDYEYNPDVNWVA